MFHFSTVFYDIQFLLLSENPSLILTSHALAHKSPNFSATFIFSEKHQKTIGERVGLKFELLLERCGELNRGRVCDTVSIIV